MKIEQIAGRVNPRVFQVVSGSRKFVELEEVARSLEMAPRDLWRHFCQANTTEFRDYLPWVIARGADRNEVDIPEWGAEPVDQDFTLAMYVDANWFWDVSALHRRGVRSVSASHHYHLNWQSPCGSGNFWCIWKQVNPLSRYRNTGFQAIFGHAEGGAIVILTDFRSYQQRAMARHERRRSPPSVINTLQSSFSR